MNVCVHNSTQFFWFCSNTVYHKSLFITCTLPDVSFQLVSPALSAETQVMRLSNCLDGLKFISSLEGASPERHPNPCLDSAGFSLFTRCFLHGSSPNISTWNQHSPM